MSEQDKPVDGPEEEGVSISPFDEGVAAGRTVPLDGEVVARLATAIPGIVSMASGAIGNANTYILKFSPNVLRGLGDGTFKLMPASGGGLRAMAIDHTNTVVGQGRLLRSGFNVAQVGALLWGVAAMVTAQKYLADISATLKILEGKIDAVKHHLEVDDWARLSSCHATLEDFHSSLNAGAVASGDSVWDAELRLAERVSREISEKYRALLERRRVAATWNFGGSVEVEPLERELEENQRLLDIAFWASSMHATVLTSLPMVQAVDATTYAQKWKRLRNTLDDLYTANWTVADRLKKQLPKSSHRSLGDAMNDVTLRIKGQPVVTPGERAHALLQDYQDWFQGRIEGLRRSVDAACRRASQPLQVVVERDAGGTFMPRALVVD